MECCIEVLAKPSANGRRLTSWGIVRHGTELGFSFKTCVDIRAVCVVKCHCCVTIIPTVVRLIFDPKFVSACVSSGSSGSMDTYVGNWSDSLGLVQCDDGDMYWVRDGSASEFNDHTALIKSGDVLRFVLTRSNETTLSMEWFLNECSLRRETKSCTSSVRVFFLHFLRVDVDMFCFFFFSVSFFGVDTRLTVCLSKCIIICFVNWRRPSIVSPLASSMV